MVRKINPRNPILRFGTSVISMIIFSAAHGLYSDVMATNGKSGLLSLPADTIWKSTNPGGGGAFGAAGAGPGGVIIAGGDLAGAYRSLDRGKTWNQIGSYQGLTDTHICGVGFDPVDAAVIFIGAEHGLYRSADSGSTFKKVINDGYITDIKIAPSNTNVGYAAYNKKYNSTDGQVYRSTDNGLSWFIVSADLPVGLHISRLLVHPGNPEVLYLLSGTTDYAAGLRVAFRSEDGGIHWTRIGASLGEVKDIALDKSNPATLYLSAYPVGGNDYLYRSEDSGNNWTRIANRSGFIWLDPARPRFIRLIEPGYQYPGGSRSGVWASSDSGQTWVRLSDIGNTWSRGWSEYFHYGESFNGFSRTFGEDLSDPDVLFWITSQWVFGTFDGGLSFRNLYTDEISPGNWQTRGINDAVLFDIEICPANSDIIYLGYFDLGIFRSSDHGRSWENCNHPVYTGAWKGDGGSCYTIVSDPSRQNVVWASMGQDRGSTKRLLRSYDYGKAESWEVAGNGLPATTSLHGLSVNAYSPESSRTLFITAERNVYVSRDDGYNWSLALDCSGKCHFTAIDRFNGNLVYAAGSGGIWRSLNSGVAGSWEPIGLPEMKGNITGDLWLSGWTGVMDIETDPSNPDWVYVAVFGPAKGLYRSKNRGNSWEKLLTDGYMRGVAVSQVNPGIIYTASSKPLNAGGYSIDSRGVQKSTDGGKTWTSVNEGLSFPFASSIETDPLNPQFVMIASPGEGCKFRNFPVQGPVRSNLQPRGTLTTGTISTTISLNTDLSATCKYSSNPGTAFDEMADSFSTSDGTLHTSLVTRLSDGNNYTYYCRCRDDKNNTNTDDFQITFRVGEDVTGLSIPLVPEIFNLSANTLPGGETNFRVTLARPADFILRVYDMTGRMVWSYVQDDAAEGIHNISWYAAAAGFTGYLRWAYNNWVRDPLLDSRFRTWPAGDLYQIYPGPRSSIRFEKFIEGIQDFEKIRLLREQFKEQSNMKKSKELEALLSPFTIEELKHTPAVDLVNEAKRKLNKF